MLIWYWTLATQRVESVYSCCSVLLTDCWQRTCLLGEGKFCTPHCASRTLASSPTQKYQILYGIFLKDTYCKILQVILQTPTPFKTLARWKIFNTRHARGNIGSVNACLYGNTGVKWINKTVTMWNQLSGPQGESPNSKSVWKTFKWNNTLTKNNDITHHQDLNATARHEDLTDVRMSTRFFPLPGRLKKL